jgi:hypothetical protein
MVITRSRRAVVDALSVTAAVKLKVPAVFGTPLSAPAVESVSPAGGEPDQRYGATPPEAVSGCPYGTPTAPRGSGELVVMLSGAVWPGKIVIAKVPLAMSPSRSVTLTVKPNRPVTAGTPVMSPLELRESPDGSAPERSENWYGGEPREALTFPE